MSASRALKELKGGRACFPALCRTSKLCPQHPCSNREPLHGTSGYSLGWMCGLGHRAGTPRDFTLEKNSFPCTFVLDTPSSFQTRQGYNPGHIFFTTFQAILPIFVRNLTCMGFMGQKNGVLAQRVCGTVNVVQVMCVNPAGGLQSMHRGERRHMGGAEGSSPPKGAISPLQADGKDLRRKRVCSHLGR